MLFLKGVYSPLPRYTFFLNTSNFFTYHWLFATMIDNSAKTNSYLTIKKKKAFQNKPWGMAHLVWIGMSEPKLTRFLLCRGGHNGWLSGLGGYSCLSTQSYFFESVPSWHNLKVTLRQRSGPYLMIFGLSPTLSGHMFTQQKYAPLPWLDANCSAKKWRILTLI